MEQLILSPQVLSRLHSILPVEHLMCRLAGQAERLMHVALRRRLEEIRVLAVLVAASIVFLLNLKLPQSFAQIFNTLMANWPLIFPVARNFPECLNRLHACLILMRQFRIRVMEIESRRAWPRLINLERHLSSLIVLLKLSLRA